MARRMLGCAGWVAMLIAGIARPGRADERAMPIAAIRTMPEESAARHTDVVLRGIVTQTDRAGRIMTVQDDSAGIWVSITLSIAANLWRGDDSLLASIQPGCVVEIDGVTEQGGFAPLILPRTIRMVGRKPLPAAAQMHPDRFFSGCDDCLRVEATAVVQGFRDDGAHWLLVLERDSRRFDARVPKAACADPAATFVDARLTIVGVAVAEMNARGEILYPRILVSEPSDVRIESPVRRSPFDAPLVSLRAIAHFQPEPLGGHRLRTQGIVTHSVPGQFFNVQDGSIGVRVETRSTDPLEPGDLVEIAGFLDRRRNTAGIIEAIYRVVGHDRPPQPFSISPPQIVWAMRKASQGGLMAKPGDYDGCLVSFPARLLDVDRGEAGGVFLVSVDGLDASVTVTLAGNTFDALCEIRPGSDLVISGILQVESVSKPASWAAVGVQRLVLGVRSAADVTVLRSPSWWTVPRLATVLLGLATVLVGSLTWIGMLRRQVVAQSVRLAGEMRSRRDSAVEFHVTLRERSRLAANLHDTILQTLAGIVLQIDVSRRSLLGGRSDDASSQLDVAKRMARHASEDLRSSVWSLRIRPMVGRSFGDSMVALVEHLGTHHTASITLRSEGTPFVLPQFVSGNLMLIAQEAIRNALNHADPHAVNVVLAYDATAREISVTVQDDGVGFSLDTAASVEQGHFGIQGMRERADGMGSRFSIESRIGQGTVVSAIAIIGKHDAELEDSELSSIGGEG